MAEQSIIQKISKNQVLRFIFSAGVGFLVDISTFHLFYHNIFDQKVYDVFYRRVGNYTLSLAVSFFLGVVVNFLITKYMVFHASQTKPAKQFIRFVSVAIVGYFANLLVIRTLIERFDFNADVARITAALSLFFASFFIHKAFSFSLSLRHHVS